MSNIETLSNVLLEKNITFLFGAGASSPFFSSLGNLEQILSNQSINKNGEMLIKMIFYKQSISDNSYLINYSNGIIKDDYKNENMFYILNEYKRFLHNILEYLKVRNSRVSPRRVNIVTTNYDLFFETALDETLESNPRVYFNDGANGYIKRILNTDNFNKTLLYSGVFDNYSNEVPAINLIKCHGSVNWQEHNTNINARNKIRILTQTSIIDTINEKLSLLIEKLDFEAIDLLYGSKNKISSLDDFINLLNNDITSDIIYYINAISDYIEEDLCSIMTDFNKLQIVFPTKKKFQTTLVNEQYFNLLRLLSYELEKEQSVLIAFGFSFYDEHISEIIQRSLNNPSLLVLIFCYKQITKKEIISQFNFTEDSIPSNILFIEPEDFLIEELANDEFKEKYNADSLNDIKTIYNENTVKIYSKEVSILDNKDPILNFDSFNIIIEKGISKKYTTVSYRLDKEGDFSE